MSPSSDQLVVIGAGTMGRGIAHLAAVRDLDVTLVDVSDEVLDSARQRIEAALDKGVARGKLTPAQHTAALARLTFTTDLEAAASTASCLIEAVPEQLTLKIEVFRRATAAAPPEALVASNTSSLPLTEIAAALPRPDRVLGLHFFNPAYIMPLLEIVRAAQTSPSTLAAAQDLGERLGKTTIVVADAPGFATSRLGLALGLEAIRMVETRIASVEDIDRAMELGYRHPMGPLMLTDLVGLDVRLAIAEHLHRELGDAFRPPPLLRRLVRAGATGRKAGIGFYDWSGEKPAPRPLDQL